VLADLKRTMDPNSVWSRFSGARSGTVRWYRAVLERLEAIGFQQPIVEELRGVVSELEKQP